ncbi:MAG TPA: glycosyltransferase, partial [Candidatus Andersenbacteria bacterium]|nr:glycosyltransferase [Candidatus Andersenbacteria bacterium]
MHVTYISSFLPRKCGVATYTHDLSLEIQNQKHQIAIVAMEHPTIPLTYTNPVIKTIRQEKVLDYKEVARMLNEQPTDIVHLQHEFGLFGGKDGEYILELAKELTKPFIVTFHTILLTPTDHQKYIIQELARLSRKIIVMEEIAKDRLENVYGLDLKDIAVILHGAPLVTLGKKEAAMRIGHPDAFILLANNLLSRNKGIEYAIEAVSKALPNIPNLLFLIVGETHPVVKSIEGESYREELMQLVKKLHVEDHVLFVNSYVSLEQLKTYLAATDIYLTPYLDPQQITSGTLSYALGAEKACIATEYVYAKEMLSQGKGILVPFKNSDAIAHAVIDLYQHPQERRAIEKRLHALSLDMQWPAVAHKHLELYRHVLLEETESRDVAKALIQKPLDLSYLLEMTDSVGLLQHAYHAIPDRRFGYSTDDNARALIVASNLEEHKESYTSQLVKNYLSFMQHAQTPNGKFHTFLSYERTWNDTEDISDAYGKALWSFGFYLYKNRSSHFASAVHSLFVTSMKQLGEIRDIRTASSAILGLYYYILAFNS